MTDSDQHNAPTPKTSPVERIKEQSDYLRGTIAEELSDHQDHFGSEAIQLIKHHGTYQQDDRDLRAAAKATGGGKAYMFMVRTRIPGGRLTSDQLLAQMDIADRLGNQTLRITSRQGLQLHGIVKSRLRETIRQIHDMQLTTWGACGDVNRNVMCCPAPHADPIHMAMNQLTDQIANYFAARSAAYHQIWLQEYSDGQLQGEKTLLTGGSGDPVEPVYGKHYLPRKFKMGIALPADNCIDVCTHDIGLLAVADRGKLVGYDVLVGGGLGVTPSVKKTFPALGQRLCFTDVEGVLDLLCAVVAVQRDYGNRSDRKVARLKYLVADWGIEAFREKVASYAGRTLAAPQHVEITGHDDHLGWREQGNGRFYYGLNVENGRILDGSGMRLKTALRTICRVLKPGIRLTAHQSLIFTDIQPNQRTELEQMLREHGVKLTEEISEVRRWSMACVAWPTCGLSITEAERALPGIIDQLESRLQEMGLGDRQFTVRMTGCPNGCARPYNADIGLVGKAKGRYTILLGGRRLGDRLNIIYQDLVREEDLVKEMAAIFACYRQGGHVDESLGDFCHRLDMPALLAFREDYLNSHSDEGS